MILFIFYITNYRYIFQRVSRWGYIIEEQDIALKKLGQFITDEKLQMVSDNVRIGLIFTGLVVMII